MRVVFCGCGCGLTYIYIFYVLLLILQLEPSPIPFPPQYLQLSPQYLLSISSSIHVQSVLNAPPNSRCHSLNLLPFPPAPPISSRRGLTASCSACCARRCVLCATAHDIQLSHNSDLISSRPEALRLDFFPFSELRLPGDHVCLITWSPISDAIPDHPINPIRSSDSSDPTIPPDISYSISDTDQVHIHIISHVPMAQCSNVPEIPTPAPFFKLLPSSCPSSSFSSTVKPLMATRPLYLVHTGLPTTVHLRAYTSLRTDVVSLSGYNTRVVSILLALKYSVQCHSYSSLLPYEC